MNVDDDTGDWPAIQNPHAGDPLTYWQGRTVDVLADAERELHPSHYRWLLGRLINTLIDAATEYDTEAEYDAATDAEYDAAAMDDLITEALRGPDGPDEAAAGGRGPGAAGARADGPGPIFGGPGCRPVGAAEPGGGTARRPYPLGAMGAMGDAAGGPTGPADWDYLRSGAADPPDKARQAVVFVAGVCFGGLVAVLGRLAG